MSAVGLLYVGAVLFINGLMLLGLVESKAAAPMNLFVGALQVVTPTYLIFTADGDPAKILAASGIYLFGFTYLYVGIGLLLNLDSTGVGYFSLFVAILAIGYSWVNFSLVGDSALGVIWLFWSFLWALFFILLGLKQEGIARYTGWITIAEGWATAAIPAFLLLATGSIPNAYTITLAILGTLVVLVLIPMARRPARRVSPTDSINAATPPDAMQERGLQSDNPLRP